jgi:hypothetical protein
VRLFVDLDETLVHSFSNQQHPRERPVNARPDFTLNFSRGDVYDFYLRPDSGLLLDFPFAILSSASQAYVDAAAARLFKHGFRIEDGFGQQFVLTAERALTTDLAVLIDNQSPGELNATRKMMLLPNGVYLQVDAWEPVWRPGPQPFSIQPVPMLEFVQEEGSRSLAEILEDVAAAM